MIDVKQSKDNTTQPLWNSLEIAKLLASVMTPLLILIFGVLINSTISSQNRVVDQKTKIYEQVGGDLNDVHAYFTYVGGWKEFSPKEMLLKKRNLDKTIQVYRPYFSDRFYTQYKNFMYSVYEKRNIQEKKETRLISISDIRKERYVSSGKNWSPEWDDLFTGEQNDIEKIRTAYSTLVRDLAKELEIN
tara:strand:- start:6544 stop:7110 length:567 start_codon:yes stop_codon:yes gene_type:complete